MTEISTENKAAAPTRVLTLFDCICIIVGTIIGAGIFEVPATIASSVPNVYWLFGMWIFGGSVALVGALCFAELTTTYPDRGGDYGYLKRAYSPQFGFAFSWAAFWVIRPGNIGGMGMIFGKFAAELFPSTLRPFQFAIVGIIGITLTNLMGLRFGKVTQNVLTVAKVVGILLIVVAALAFWSQAATGQQDAAGAESAVASQVADASTELVQPGWFWLSMVFVMFAFGGWNDIAFVATEVQEPRRNLVRSLMIGTGIVLSIYLLINAALVFGLGFDRMVELNEAKQNVTSVLVRENIGELGTKCFAVLVCVSCLGAVNAMVFTSPRIFWATAEDFSGLSWMAASQNGQGWRRAMVLLALVTVGFIAVFGTGSDGFKKITAATAPYFWTFLGFTVISLIVGRVRFAGKFDGYRVPLGPVLPILFAAACAFMVYRSVLYMLYLKYQIPTILIGIWAILGVVLSFPLGRRRDESEAGSPGTR